MLKYFIITSVMLAFVPKASNQFFGNNLDFGNLGNSITNMINENLAQAGIYRNRNEYDRTLYMNNVQNRQKSLHAELKEQNNIFEQNMKKFNNKLQAQMHDLQLKLSAPQVKLAMLKGTGGSSIVEYGNNNVIVAINNNNYKCFGSIVLPSRGNSYISCNGNFVPVDKNDPCIPGIMKMQINDILCIGEHASLLVVNNNAACENGILYKQNQLKNKCGLKYGTNNYAHVTYYPAIENGNHIPIPNDNKYVQCLNHDTSHCNFFTNDVGLIF